MTHSRARLLYRALGRLVVALGVFLALPSALTFHTIEHLDE